MEMLKEFQFLCTNMNNLRLNVSKVKNGKCEIVRFDKSFKM